MNVIKINLVVVFLEISLKILPISNFSINVHFKKLAKSIPQIVEESYKNLANIQ